LRDLEEEPAEQADHGDRRTVGRAGDGERASGSVAREVGRTNDALGVGQVRGELAPRPGVISEGDDVSTGREEPIGELRSQASAVGCVLAVDDAERGAEVVAETSKPLFEGATPRGPDDVRNKEDSQGRAVVAAG
jgi:hypothetical protein